MRALLSDLELFRVTSMELSGQRYLTAAEAVSLAAVPDGASVWDDPASWEARLRSHELVRDARIRRRLPGTLVVVLEEREPVALVPTPTLEPVDETGRLLPIDPAVHRLDVPLIRVADVSDGSHQRVVSTLAREAARLRQVAPIFSENASELALDDRAALQVLWGEPAVVFRIRPGAPEARLNEGIRALAHARAQAGSVEPTSVDLRFADQVVVALR